MSAHARFGPSGYNGWSNCVDWASDPTPSKWAEAGTLAHEVGACLLLGQKTPDVGIDVLRDMQDYADWVQSQRTHDSELHVEIPLDISWMTGEANAKGTADAVIVDYKNRSLTVIDLKTGRRRVNATDNGQLQMYAAAAVAFFTDAAIAVDGEPGEALFDKVNTMIYQASIDHIDTHTIAVNELMGWAQAVRPAKTIRPGVKQCQWCMKKAECESYANWVHTKVDAIDPKKPGLDLTKLSESYKVVDAIESWCRAVKDAAKRTLENGEQLPGFKLVQGRYGNRKWTDEDTVEALMKNMRLKRDLIYKKQLITPTAATDTLKSELSSKQWEQLQQHVIRKEPSLQIAPISDHRGAYEKPQFEKLDALEDAKL
jgi:hypothetical protein